ncbi:MAG: hypothetical protein H6508_09055 [Calditrichaeota bacterium]|nr:hypothetical protein [Calditrichota bacterium]
MVKFVFIVALVFIGNCFAYPEFQRFSQENSGRPINCAMCHVNGDGPEGASRGQIGSLTPVELNRLNAARGAFAPGMPVESPILNAFGNNIIRKIGKTKFLELRAHPEQLAEAYGFQSDLDEDGIPDAQEYLDGTNPLNRSHGNPWKLFVHNLNQYKLHIFLIILATVAGFYGLSNLLHGFAIQAESHEARN